MPTKEGPHCRNHFILGESKGCNMLLECVHCGKGRDKLWLANATRARSHLSGEGTGVKACTKVPENVRCLFRKPSASLHAAGTSNAVVQSTLVGGSSPMLAHKRHDAARSAETKCIIYNGISFNVVDSDAWCEMIKAVASDLHACFSKCSCNDRAREAGVQHCKSSQASPDSYGRIRLQF
jgi:hypothetical protein